MHARVCVCVVTSEGFDAVSTLIECLREPEITQKTPSAILRQQHVVNYIHE